MSKISSKDINDTRNLQTKASFSFEVIHASMPWIAIGHAVLYYARAAHAFSAGITCKCPYCTHDSGSWTSMRLFYHFQLISHTLFSIWQETDEEQNKLKFEIGICSTFPNVIDGSSISYEHYINLRSWLLKGMYSRFAQYSLVESVMCTLGKWICNERFYIGTGM